MQMSYLRSSEVGLTFVLEYDRMLFRINCCNHFCLDTCTFDCSVDQSYQKQKEWVKEYNQKQEDIFVAQYDSCWCCLCLTQTYQFYAFLMVDNGFRFSGFNDVRKLYSLYVHVLCV